MNEKPLLQYVHHVNYVVENRDAMVEYIEKNFGMKPDEVVDYVDGNGLMKEALYDIGKTHIQITEATVPTSKIAQWLAKCGPGVYHVAWAVDNIEKVTKELDAKGNKFLGNKISGTGGIKPGSRGYKTSNLDPTNSHNVWFQFAEGARMATKR